MNANFKTASNNELVDMFKKGQEQAFGELYERHYKIVYNRCRQICKDQDVAADLSQEVMLKAFAHLHEFRGTSLFKTWIYTIASRHCFSYLQREKSTQAFIDNMPETWVDEKEEDQHEIMMTLIKHLPQEEKHLLLNKYEVGTPIEDLEKILNLSASAIKMRLKRSREKLNVLYSLALTVGLEQAINSLELM